METENNVNSTSSHPTELEQELETLARQNEQLYLSEPFLEDSGVNSNYIIHNASVDDMVMNYCRDDFMDSNSILIKDLDAAFFPNGNDDSIAYQVISKSKIMARWNGMEGNYLYDVIDTNVKYPMFMGENARKLQVRVKTSTLSKYIKKGLYITQSELPPDGSPAGANEKFIDMFIPLTSPAKFVCAIGHIVPCDDNYYNSYYVVDYVDVKPHGVSSMLIGNYPMLPVERPYNYCLTEDDVIRIHSAFPKFRNSFSAGMFLSEAVFMLRRHTINTIDCNIIRSTFLLIQKLCHPSNVD